MNQTPKGEARTDEREAFDKLFPNGDNESLRLAMFAMFSEGWRAALAQSRTPEPAPSFAAGDKVIVPDGHEGRFEGTVTCVDPVQKRYHVHIHKGYGGRYGEWELRPSAGAVAEAAQQATDDLSRFGSW